MTDVNIRGEWLKLGRSLVFKDGGGVTWNLSNGNEISVSAVSGASIPPGSVSNTELASMAAGTIKGRAAGGGTGSPQDLTASQVKTILAISLSSDVTGTLQAAQAPAFSGDVTSSAGSLALTIANDAVTNAKAANMADSTIKGRAAGAGTGDPTDLTAAQVKTILALSAGDISGLAPIATSGSAADLSTGTLPNGRFPALVGDVTTSAGSLSTTIANNAVTTAKILNSNVTYAKIQNVATAKILGRVTSGSGVVEELTAAQVKTLLNINLNTDISGTLQASQMPALTGDVTTGGASLATTIANDAVTYAKMQNVSASPRFLGRITAGAGDVEELTGTQATTLLNAFTTSLQGLAPASGGGTSNFLRADGSWTVPPGAGSGTVTSVDITPPAAGITATGGPITTAGAITLALANDLAALEGLSSTGIAVRSGTDTWVQRSIAGTASRVAVTNGSGVSGNPTVDIDAAYVGQSSITTLGTITTGVWHGTAIDLSTYASGTLQAAQEPAHTGDVTNSAGSLALTIAAGAVSLAKMANLAANSVIGNNTGSPATPIALTAAQVKTLLAISLTTDVTGTLQAAQEPAHTGDVTNSAGSLALTIANNAVTTAKILDSNITYAKIQNVSATSRILGRITAGAGVVEELTAANVKTILAIAYTDVSGLATVAHTGAYSDLTGTPTIPTGANPTANIAATAVNGAAATFMRSDAAPALLITGGLTFASGSLTDDATIQTMWRTVATIFGGIASDIYGGVLGLDGGSASTVFTGLQTLDCSANRLTV